MSNGDGAANDSDPTAGRGVSNLDENGGEHENYHQGHLRQDRHQPPHDGGRSEDPASASPSTSAEPRVQTDLLERMIREETARHLGAAWEAQRRLARMAAGLEGGTRPPKKKEEMEETSPSPPSHRVEGDRIGDRDAGDEGSGADAVNAVDAASNPPDAGEVSLPAPVGVPASSTSTTKAGCE